jgi:hypothetical protein
MITDAMEWRFWVVLATHFSTKREAFVFKMFIIDSKIKKNTFVLLLL